MTLIGPALLWAPFVLLLVAIPAAAMVLFVALRGERRKRIGAGGIPEPLCARCKRVVRDETVIRCPECGSSLAQEGARLYALQARAVGSIDPRFEEHLAANLFRTIRAPATNALA